MHNILFSISRARGVFRFIMVSGKISKIFVTFRLFILLRLLSKCAYGVVMAKIHFRIVVYWLSFPFGSCDFLCFKEICSRTIPIFYSKDWKWLRKSYIKKCERSELWLFSKYLRNVCHFFEWKPPYLFNFWPFTKHNMLWYALHMPCRHA